MKSRARDKYGIWTQRQIKPLLPDWMMLLLTPVMYGLFLGVLLLVVPVGLVLRAMLEW